MNKRLILLTVILLVVIFTTKTNAQSEANVVTTGVPFLTVAPESRGSSLGDAGVSTTPDVNSQHWNPAKYAFVESEAGISISYTPWLRTLVGDIDLSYLVGYKRLDDLQTMSGSLRYFGLGSMISTDEYGTEGAQINPNEFAIDLGYARLLSESFSGAVALRYIRSDLTGGVMVGSTETHPGNAYAADVAFYYQKEMRNNRKRSTLGSGINISNIGSKISYTDGETKDFIPTNLKLGASYKTEMDRYNTISFVFDANKLLVPTPDPSSTDPNGGNDDVGPIEGIFVSFADAPGGWKEEMQEITFSVGAEYWYNKQFALRCGYFYENVNKGNRKFFTAGAGLKMNVFALDFSYLVAQQNSPLSNTLRVTLSFDFEAFNKQKR
jgi:hypothetical protein